VRIRPLQPSNGQTAASAHVPVPIAIVHRSSTMRYSWGSARFSDRKACRCRRPKSGPGCKNIPKFQKLHGSCCQVRKDRYSRAMIYPFHGVFTLLQPKLFSVGMPKDRSYPVALNVQMCETQTHYAQRRWPNCLAIPVRSIERHLVLFCPLSHSEVRPT
jgi:hypothetical protein